MFRSTHDCEVLVLGCCYWHAITAAREHLRAQYLVGGVDRIAVICKPRVRADLRADFANLMYVLTFPTPHHDATRQHTGE